MAEMPWENVPQFAKREHVAQNLPERLKTQIGDVQHRSLNTMIGDKSRLA